MPSLILIKHIYVSVEFSSKCLFEGFGVFTTQQFTNGSFLLEKLMKERKGRKMVTAMYTILNGMEYIGRYQRINLISFVGNLQHSSFYVTP